MRLRKNIQTSIFMALVVVVGVALAPACLAQDGAAPDATSKPVRCAFTSYRKGALKGAATPIATSPGEASIEATGIAICTGDKGKYFSFALKGTGNFSCDGASSFTGELQLEKSTGTDVAPAFSAEVSKADLRSLDAKSPPEANDTKRPSLVAVGNFISGPFESSTATVTLKKQPECASTSVANFASTDLLLLVSPAK